MVATNKKKLSLLDILVSIPTDPTGMMMHLLQERRYPPYLFALPIGLFVMLAGPPLYYQFRLGIDPVRPEVTYALVLALILTLFGFSLFLAVLLRILFVPASVMKILAGSLYSLAALIPFNLAFYLGNYLASGSFSILPYLSTGLVKDGDWFLGFFPTVTKFALLVVFIVFVSAMKAIARAKTSTAFGLSVLAVPVLVGSFVVATTVADAVFPDTGYAVVRFVTSFIAPIGEQ